MKTEKKNESEPKSSDSSEASKALSSKLLFNVIDTLDRMGIEVPFASFEEELQKTPKTD